MTEAPSAFAWFAYRTWSWRVLEGVLGVPGWRCAAVVTTPDCVHDFTPYERAGIPVLRVDPSKDLSLGGIAHEAIVRSEASVAFHYGWSWRVPRELRARCLNLTLHPGKLPRDRGGSPIQNQIRAGEEWTYANLIELADEIDAGAVYGRARIALSGADADGAWARMIAAGVLLTRRFLADFASGRARGVAQDTATAPAVHRRVTPAEARLSPSTQTARQLHDIVRAHNETDANSYVRAAWLPCGPYRLVVERASLGELPELPELWVWNGEAPPGERLFELCLAVNNGEGAIRVPAHDGRSLFVTRCYLRALAGDDDDRTSSLR